jgi:hypothetical protein
VIDRHGKAKAITQLNVSTMILAFISWTLLKLLSFVYVNVNLMDIMNFVHHRYSKRTVGFTFVNHHLSLFLQQSFNLMTYFMPLLHQ